MTTKFISTLCVFFSTFMVFGQLPLKKENYTQEVSNPKAIPLCEATHLGFSLPIDESIKKYDRIKIQIRRKKIGSDDAFYDITNAFFSVMYFYPNSKTFMDIYEGKKEIDICIRSTPSTTTDYLFYDKSFCDNSETTNRYVDYEYKIAIEGYFKNGTESYWDEYSESIKTRDIYKFSKDVYATVPFRFVLSADDKVKLEKIKAQEELMEKIKENESKLWGIYTVEVEVPFVGTTQPRIEIYNAYYLLRDDLIEKEDYETLYEVSTKMVNIERKYNVLNKTLKGETDTEVIKEEILKFPY